MWKYFILLLFITLSNNLFAQREADLLFVTDKIFSDNINIQGINIHFTPNCSKLLNESYIDYSNLEFKYNDLNYGHFQWIPMTLCDSVGKLLFFTNGYNIWNKYKKKINNADNINGGIEFEKYLTQSLIIPYPEFKNKYIIFNIDSYYNMDTIPRFSNIVYSIIEFSSQNDSGTVLQKNIQLGNNKFDYINLLPVAHKNGKDIWLIAVDTNGYVKLFLFNKDGLLIKEYLSNFIKLDIFKGIINRKILNLVNIGVSFKGNIVKFTTDSSLTLCKFDNNTGIFKDIIKFNYNDNIKSFFNNSNFSPNGNFIISNSPLTIYNLNDWDSTKIIGSKKIVSNDNTYTFQSPKGDIFVIHPNEWKSYIQNCYYSILNFNNDSYTFIKNIFKSELNPNSFFLNWYNLPYHAFLYHFIDYKKPVCETQKLEFDLLPFVPKGAEDDPKVIFEWKGPENFFSLLRRPSIDSVTQKNSGWYYLTLFTPEDTLRDSLYIDIPLKNYIKIQSNKTTPCPGDTVTLAIDSTYKSIYWNTGDSTQSIKVAKPGKYTIMIEDENCCNSYEEIEVVYSTAPNPEIEIIGNNPSCFGDTVIIKPKNNYPVILWDDSDTNRIRKITKTTAFELTVIDSNGCSAKSTIEIKFANKPKPTIAGDTKICLGTISTYEITTNKTTKKDITISGGSIQSRTENEIRILWDKVGDYLVEIIETDTINGCIGKTSLNITVDSLKKPTIRQDIPLCYGSIGKLSVLDAYDTYFWSTGEKTQSIFVTKSGTYKVVCTLSGGCSDSSEKTVNEVPKPKIEIISDKGNTICQKGEKVTLSVNPNDPEYSYFWSTGLITPSITVSDSGTYYLFAVNKYGCADTAIYRINIAPEFTPEITANKFKICKGEELELSANPNQTDYKYLWSNGLTSSKITIKDPGTYKVKVSNQFGCTKEIEQKIGQNPSISIQLDTSRAQIGNSTEITMTIFCESKIQLNNIEIKLIIDGSSLIITEEQQYLTYNYLPNQNLELILKIDSIDFSKNNINQFKIRGNTLLANNLNNPIIIDNVSLKADEFCIEKIPGALILEKICTYDLRKVKLIDEFNFEILPIPASDYIEVTYTSNNNEQSIIKYDIYNIYGENILCSSSHFNNNSNNIKSKIDISTLPTGVYFIKIGDKFEKFVKM